LCISFIFMFPYCLSQSLYQLKPFP
jgi:hypothetical protein